MARSPCKVRVRNSGFLLAFALLSVRYGVTQSMPTTAGETLSGNPVVLADVVRGRASVLVAGFSREGGFKTGEWVKSLHGDPAFAHLPVYQVAEIAAAPGFVRGMIRNGMKKGLTPAQQQTSSRSCELPCGRLLPLFTQAGRARTHAAPVPHAESSRRESSSGSRCRTPRAACHPGGRPSMGGRKRSTCPAD